MMKNPFGIGSWKNAKTSYEDFEKRVASLARVGFTESFVDYGEYDDLAKQLRIFDKYGVHIDSMHAPFLKINCIWRDEPAGDDYIEWLNRCVDNAAALHIDKMVSHPISGECLPQSNVLGVERLNRFIDHAEKRGVKVCFENVEFTEMLGFVMAEFGDRVGFCYDTGHEHTNDPGIRMLKLFGDRLMCTHIHDNYGLSYKVTPILHGDCHMIPLDASIDFHRVMHDIRSVNFTGVLMLECSARNDLGTYLNYTIDEFYEHAYAALTEIASYED